MSAEDVTVIIPAFNSARYIGEAIDSVLRQSMPAAHVVVVDDGSMDDTAQIAASYSGVTVMKQAHAGVSAARNLGTSSTRSDFLAFLDSDDVWHPDKLRLQVQRAREQATAGIVMCWQKYVFEFGVPAWFRGPTDGSAEPGFQPSNWLVRRETWDSVGEFAVGMTHSEDTDWLARASDQGIAVSVVEAPLVTHRIHDANASGMAKLVRAGVLQALRDSVRRKEAGHAP